MNLEIKLTNKDLALLQDGCVVRKDLRGVLVTIIREQGAEENWTSRWLDDEMPDSQQ